jgi:hypothetical protein
MQSPPTTSGAEAPPPSLTAVKAAVEVLTDVLRRAPVQSVEQAVDHVSDALATGDRSDDACTESILDGIRWGCRAAASVELGGGTLLRIIAPHGTRITHEWLDTPVSGAAAGAVLHSVREAMGLNAAGGQGEPVDWSTASATEVLAELVRLVCPVNFPDFPEEVEIWERASALTGQPLPSEEEPADA